MWFFFLSSSFFFCCCCLFCFVLFCFFGGWGGGGEGRGVPGQCVTRYASRHSTNQNALFVEWFSRLETAFFRGEYGESFALFQVCVGNFDTIPPWKVVGTYYLDNSFVTFKYFAFLSVWDKLVHEPPWSMVWVLFSPFFLDSLLVTVSSFNRFYYYFRITFPLCKFRGLPGSTVASFPVMKRRKCLGMKRSSQPSSRTREASNAKSWRVCSILNR